jgi:hypothetical protein
VGHGHELGQYGSSKDGVVRRLEVCHLELDVFIPEVFPHAKGHWEGHSPERCSRVPWYNAVEGSFAWVEHIRDVPAHLLQSTRKEKIEAAFSIDEYSGEPNNSHHRIQHKLEFSQL